MYVRPVSHDPLCNAPSRGRARSRRPLRAGLLGLAVVASGFGLAAAPGEEGASGDAAGSEEIVVLVARGKAFAAKVHSAGQTVRGQLRTARSAQDVVKVLCLNDKLNQVDVAGRSAGDHVEVLTAAANDNDLDAVRLEVTVLEVLSESSATLVSEAAQCIGEDTGFAGETEVSSVVDPTIPALDTESEYGAGNGATAESLTNPLLFQSLAQIGVPMDPPTPISPMR